MSKIGFQMALVVMVAIVGLASMGYVQTVELKFTSIDFPEGTLTTARGINNHGEIVGAYRIDPPRHALLIKKSKFIPLAPTTILGTNYSEATNINDRGDIVGQMLDENGFGHGFLLKDGVLTMLDFPGASETFALGINDAGIVDGYWDLLDADFNTLAVHGFTWKDGAFTQFDFPGAQATAFFGINARGDLVGVWLPDLSSHIEHALACPKAAQCFSFDAPVDGTILTQADEINAHAQIVGVYIGIDDVSHAFLMVGATFTSFDFPGATGTGAYGINSAGQIVGKYFAADGSTHAFWRNPPRRENRSSCSLIPEPGETIAEDFWLGGQHDNRETAFHLNCYSPVLFLSPGRGGQTQQRSGSDCGFHH
jgi:uncharacterized membrane protein